GAACHIKYLALGYHDFDLAIHSQSVRNITRGSGDCSILGIPFLGNHMVLILFLLAPAYLVFSSPLLLLYIQTLVIAAGAWGVYLMAKRELDPRWGAGLALVYLVYPPLIYMNLYEFHPIALATTFLLYAMHFFKADRFRLFMLFLALAMLCQENVALIAIFFALYALVCRKTRKWAIVPGVVGLVFFVLVVCIIMPALNRNTVQFLRIYSHLAGEPGGNASSGAIIGGMLSHPVRTAQHCLHPLKLNFLNSIAAPLGYLSLAGPLALIPALPILAQRLLSDRVSETLIAYHYQAELVPFIFASAIAGIRNLRKLDRKMVSVGALLLVVAFPTVALLTSGVVPTITEAITATSRQTAVTREAKEVLAGIPDDASVVATFRFLPRLASRRELHSLHHVYHGKHTLSDVPYPPPDDVDYLVLDTNDRVTFLEDAFYSTDAYRNIQAVLGTARWEVVSQLDSFLALRRSRGDGPPLSLVSEAPPDVSMSTNFTCTTGEAIELVGFAAGTSGPNANLPVTLYWRKPAASDADYDMLLTVSDGSVVHSQLLSPGSRIWPPQSWEAGKVIQTGHCVHVNQGVSPDDIQLTVRLIPRRQPLSTP
ncbi:DUF2079 domain-containing protein, partial [Verrucomicrobiota bacterium]